MNLAFVHLKRWNTDERGHCVLDLVLRGHISGDAKYNNKDANILVVFVYHKQLQANMSLTQSFLSIQKEIKVTFEVNYINVG